jgi:hypothetical protein
MYASILECDLELDGRGVSPEEVLAKFTTEGTVAGGKGAQKNVNRRRRRGNSKAVMQLPLLVPDCASRRSIS